MVPQKKKTVSRKRVLDLESSAENSPQRSPWQAKYKELLPADSPKSRNGTAEGKSSTLGGLVGDYDSSSESESESSRDSKIKVEKVDPAPVQSTPQIVNETNGGQYQIPGSSWIECYDRNSGFPYYWNQVNNQVTWQPPPEYAALQLMRKQQALKPNTAETSLVTTPSSEIKENKKPAVSKKNRKWDWDGRSDSEEDRVEKPPSGDESENESKLPITEKNKTSLSKKLSSSHGPRLLLTNEDGHDVYETSSLMTPLVPDTGPPGEEPPASNSATANGITESSNDCEISKNRGGQQNQPNLELADKILAEIEKEVPPDFVKSLSRRPSSDSKPSTSFALIASYGDDSDQEEANESPPKPRCLFPSVDPSVPVTPKTLFPSAVENNEPVEVKPISPVVNPETPRRQLLVSNSPPAVLDPNLPDSSMTFKRKKRIEFATAPRSEIVPKTEIVSKPSEPLPDYAPVTEPTIRYNMEPGERRGFGFSHLEQKSSGEKKTAAIQFIKAETFSLQSSLDITKPPKENSPIPSQDLVDGAALLKEKLTFLGEGKEEVSAVQQMAIQLETLVSAWQSGALTPAYLSQWLGSRAVELSKNEQAAAPPGWTCEWERDAKRYCYRNTASGTLVWDYPDGDHDTESKASPNQDSVQDEVEMELSDTPPRSSPSDLDSVPPPPPDISRISTPPPPPAPTITKCIDEGSSNGEETRNIPPPPPPEENYPPPPPPELDQPLPPGVDGSGNNRHSQPPLPRLPPLDSLSNSRTGSPIGSPSVGLNDASSGRKRCLTSELDSFYMDLAKLGDSDSVATSDNDSPKPTRSLDDSPKGSGGSDKQTSRPPLPPEIPVKSRRYSPPPQPQTTFNQDIANKRRKKGKLGPGLTLKKKGVSTLVAKWQQVQEEARKDYSSNEENNDA